MTIPIRTPLLESSPKTTLRLCLCSLCGQQHALWHWPKGVYHDMEYVAYESRLDIYVHPSCLVHWIECAGELLEVDMTPLKRLFGLDEYIRLMNENELQRSLWIHRTSTAARKWLDANKESKGEYIESDS